jgi:plastocyanin
MNKGLSTVLIIVVLAAGVGGAYLFYKNANKKADTAVQNNTSQQQAAENVDGSNTPTHPDDTSSTSTNQSNAVTIKGFAYSPSSITVKKGTTVTWTNQDSVEHNVVSEQEGGPKSDLLKKGGTFSFTFDKIGTFTYICSVHPQMKGTVTVTD